MLYAMVQLHFPWGSEVAWNTICHGQCAHWRAVTLRIVRIHAHSQDPDMHAPPLRAFVLSLLDHLTPRGGRVEDSSGKALLRVEFE